MSDRDLSYMTLLAYNLTRADQTDDAQASAALCAWFAQLWQTGGAA